MKLWSFVLGLALANIVTTTVLSFTFIPVHAQGPVEIQLSVDPPEVTVGDQITFTLQANHPVESRVVPIRVEEQWGPFEVRQLTPLGTETTDGGTASTQRIHATLWATGTFTTPAISLAVIHEDGSEARYDVEPATVIVKSVLIPGDNTLRDIKPQATLPRPSIWPSLLLATGVLLILLLLAWLWRRWRQNRTEAPVENTPVITRPAHLIALDELQRIEALHLPTQRQFAEHYDLVTDVVRRYLVQAFDIPALDLTTAELQQLFRQSSNAQKLIGPIEKTHMIQLLEEADLIKFAKVEPEFRAAADLPGRARDIILSMVNQPLTGMPQRGTQSQSGVSVGDTQELAYTAQSTSTGPTATGAKEKDGEG
ncbi:MAG: hypothetical protein AAF702_31065 [Chloroflexota bacterium]